VAKRSHGLDDVVTRRYDAPLATVHVDVRVRPRLDVRVFDVELLPKRRILHGRVVNGRQRCHLRRRWLAAADAIPLLIEVCGGTDGDITVKVGATRADGDVIADTTVARSTAARGGKTAAPINTTNSITIASPAAAETTATAATAATAPTATVATHTATSLTVSLVCMLGSSIHLCVGVAVRVSAEHVAGILQRQTQASTCVG
jgi:hypothetical protein